ncbi:nitrilase-related carbon-nitrogen hydrolase [Acidiphilium sp. PM]|uniref:nitrilase-related carbon-nitrogen hydrolase n=1 Tax=Acidiphilium sp. PM TaxID=1043206 RepID=UPI0013016EC7|nr:nitrilase-related carbon-nitrogen hydrolase [Acidiphilium sp. PM]
MLVTLYFLSASAGLVPGAGVFFGHGATSYILGLALWLGSSLILAAPWMWADTEKPWTIIVALVIDAVPPIGLFGWVSPITAAGILFPGSGVIGIVLLFAWIVSFHWYLNDAGSRTYQAILIASLVLNSSTGFNKNIAPLHFSAVNTNLGPQPENPVSVISRNSKVIAAARADKSKIVVLPETVATWLPGTAAQYAASVPPGRTWLVGATTQKNGSLWDSVVGVRRGKPSNTLFRAAFPVPVSMWHPWKTGGYGATWDEPVKTIDGVKVASVICYDQLLVWPWLEVMVGNPQLIITPRNDWWARGTGIPRIQRDTSIAFSRLIGAREITATNW